MKKNKDKELFLEQLRKTPIIQVACEKTNISRQTAYRWKREDPDFSTSFDAALKEGRELINDVAISQLLQAIKNGNMTAIQLWLKNFDENFKTKVEISGTVRQVREELTDEETEILKEALRLAGYTPQALNINIHKETNAN